jgi:hypothetical protein
VAILQAIVVSVVISKRTSTRNSKVVQLTALRNSGDDLGEVRINAACVQNEELVIV